MIHGRSQDFAGTFQQSLPFRPSCADRDFAEDATREVVCRALSGAPEGSLKEVSNHRQYITFLICSSKSSLAEREIRETASAHGEVLRPFLPLWYLSTSSTDMILD